VFDQRRPTRNGECGTWPQSHIDLSRCWAARSRLQHRRRRVWICAHSTYPVAAPLPATRAHQLPVSTLAPYPLLQGLGPLIDLVPANPCSPASLGLWWLPAALLTGFRANRPDQPIRSTLERPVPGACPINATSVLNGTDNYRLQCYVQPEKNCALWNGVMAPSPPHVALMKIIRDQTTPRKLHPGRGRLDG
jgi:hypothetical protein